MKNKKGFTLVEMLAVVAILIIVIAIITPKIFTQFKHAEKVTDQEQINSLIETAKIYMNQNSNLLPEENNIYTISLNDLKESGLIQTKEILNPSTKEELTGFIIVKYENNKYKYEYKEENEQITVTFDPQGGTLQETSKNVILGEKYGTLPTPTREGYKFIGWNGKNKLEIPVEYATAAETRVMPIEEMFFVKAGNYTYPRTVSNATQWREAIAIKNINGENLSENDYKPQSSFYFSNPYGIWLIGSDTSDTTRTYTITIKEDCYIKFMIMFGDASEATIITDAQLEVGDTATEYEPYQEYTSSTTVTKEENHTLYAIWKANE